MDMIFVIAVPVLLLAAIIGAVSMLHRRPGKPESHLEAEELGLLRKIDQLILSNMSLPYVSQEIVDLIAQSDHILGAAIQFVDKRSGDLTVLAVSHTMQLVNHPSLAPIMGTRSTADEFQRSGSPLAQAINERRLMYFDRLRDVVSPPLKVAEADHVQKHFGIKTTAAHPIIVEDSVSGVMTFYLSRAKEHQNQREQELFSSIVNEVGIALENARLTEELGSINRKLEEANEHLKELDATKDEFISIASHQLRSPLTAIKGYLSMLDEGDYGEMSDEQRGVVEQLSQSANEVINLINDMLSVSRINAAKFDLTLVPVDLAEVVSEVVNELRPLAVRKDLELVVDVPTESGSLMLDALRIRQVLLNFVDNAIKYTPQGKVTVRLEKTEHEVVFTVSDSGIGIPKDEIEHLFAKFYRAKNAQQMVTAGSGLGLFVAKRIIEDHDGTCVVESIEGKGSTFGFKLPVPERLQGAAAKARFEPQKAG